MSATASSEPSPNSSLGSLLDQRIRNALTRYRKIAVVGLSPNPMRPSHGVTRYMILKGYEIVGVRPAIDTILGRPCYPRLGAVPGSLEIVNVFRNSQAIPALVDELIPMRPKVLWLQEGVTHPDAERRAREAGIEVFSDLCILKEHRRLIASK